MADDITFLLRRLAGDRDVDVELVCGEHPDPLRGQRGRFVVGLNDCAAELSLASFLLMAGGGHRVSVRGDGCANAARLHEVATRTQTLIAAAGRDPALLNIDRTGGRRRREVHPIGTLPPLTRRQLFLLPQQTEVALPEAGATEHERELFALEQLAGGPIPAAVRSLPATSATLESSGCTACGVCTRACPEGALVIERSPDAFTLRESLRACVDCGDCIRLCPEQVLVRKEPASWGEVADDLWITVEEGPARSCARCHANFRPTADELHCPTCTFRMANPFGSRLPHPGSTDG